MSGLDDLFGPQTDDVDDPFADIGRFPVADTTQEVKIDQVFGGHDTSAVPRSTETTFQSIQETEIGYQGPTSPYSSELNAKSPSQTGWYDEQHPKPAPPTSAVQSNYVPTGSVYTYEHNPYVPPATQVVPAQSLYAPPATAQTQYTPQTQYVPPAVSQSPPFIQSHAATTTITSPYGYNSNAASIPAPPAPRMPLNRPAISNAYDPPFPTTSSVTRSKRNISLTSTTHPPPPSFPSPASLPPQRPVLEHHISPGLPHQPFPAHPTIDGLLQSSFPPQGLSSSSPPQSSSISSQLAHHTSLDNLKDDQPARNGVPNGYYSPPPSFPIERTGSPASIYSLTDTNQPPSVTYPLGNRSEAGPPLVNPYAPKKQNLNGHAPPPFARPGSHHPTPSMRYVPQTDLSRDRSSSHTGTEDPYALDHSRQGTTVSHSQNESDTYSAVPAAASTTLAPPQEIIVKASTHAPYAPSPSLVGTNDPLGRTAARAPVFSFGFGGKFVTCFHGASTINTGFDVALSSRNSTGVQIRVLNKLIPQSALESSSAVFPGPLFQDPGSPTGLVRPGASAQVKAKKARLLKYLSDREQEMSLGAGYLHVGSPDWRSADGKLVLVRLLKVLVENDGRLSGTPQVEAAVRAALVPRLETLVNETTPSTNLAGFSSLADVHNESPISVSTLKASSLDKIQEFLLQGQRRQAYHYALDERLWAHAMIIASGIDKEAWKEVVNEFLKTELGTKDSSGFQSRLQPSDALGPAVNGREGLRVAYSLLSGQGAASVQELVPQKMLSSITIAGTTPLSPNFMASSVPSPIPQETLSKWAEIVAMMLSGATTPETSAALTALGDQLNGNQWIEAAHACYLLSPQTSPIGGLGHSSARITLVGSLSPQIRPNFFKDSDPIIFSEILEFALSSAPAPKGQDTFGGFPHLQAYRFIRAVSLAEIGEVQLANRYCEAITASLARASPYFTPVLFEQLKGLMNRIHGVTQVDKAGSWMGGKLSKPSLDSIGGWLEGRFTKLVTGDTESATSPEEDATKASERGFVGPFSHYSTISSTTTSTTPSPQPTVVNPYAVPRAGSAMSNRPTSNNYAPTDRASSAMDYTRRRSSPAPRMASASATTTTFSQASSFMAQSANLQESSTEALTPKTSHDDGQEVGWWGSSYSSNQTPTAATFVQVGDTGLPSANTDGFISLMDSTPLVPASPVKKAIYNDHEDEEEDLGFGNSKPRERNGADEGQKPDAQKQTPQAAPERPAVPVQSNSSGWFTRWWKGSGPPKANLGEETTTFYYDKELKRWVNKNAGTPEEAKSATPPPPPSRAQTASPGMTGHNRPPLPGTTPPPARAASAIDLSGSPPPPPGSRSSMRIRSNLVPAEADTAPSTPMGSREGSVGPPSGRPRSQASKRNVRSRYVDVFQEGAT